MPRAPRRAGVIAAAVVALCCAAAPAFATTYYITTTGNDSNAGTSLGAPWKTIAKANTTLRGGDVVFISPGTYTDPIKPTASGSSITSRISYVGSITAPSLISVGDIFLERSYVSVKGVSSRNGITLYYTSESAKAVYDSVSWCISASGFGSAGGKNSVISRNTINGGISFLMNNYQAGPPGIAASIADTLRGNIIHIGTVTLKGFQLRGFTSYCVIDSNKIDLFFAVANGGDLQGRYLYNTYFNTFRDNSWRMESDGGLAGNQYTGFALRDSSHDNLFERDSMLCGVQSGFDIGGRLVNAGNASWTGQCVRNHWKDCLFLTTGNTFNQDILDQTIIEGCVFASKHSYGLYILGPIKNTIIRNCTFASWVGAGMRIEGDPRGGGNQFYSNIWYADSVAACLTGKTCLFHGYATGFTQNNNLFFARTQASGVTAANQSIYWASSSCSAPGAGTGWSSSTGNDLNSKYGNPKFVNTTFANFDPHIQSGSLAVGLGAGGVDAGAFSLTAGGPDITPPASINNLSSSLTSDQNLVLTWSAPGDDGSSGVAAAYDLRYSTSPITDNTTFASAPSASPQPIPGSSGSAQSYVFTGLTPGAHYYFAIKTRDESNNWSTLGTVYQVTMHPTDDVAPKATGDLH